MVNRSVPGQLDLFQIDDFKNTVASNFSSGLSSVSTRTKVLISPQITREVQDLKGTAYEDTLDLVQDADIALTFEVNGDVKQCLILLQNESPETLSALLPAIAEYARDDDR